MRIFAITLLTGLSALSMAAVNVWDFSGDSLMPTTNGTGNAGEIDYLGTGSETFGSVEFTTGTSTTVRMGSDNYLRMRSGLGANGGGGYVNVYSIMIDMILDEAGSVGIHQTGYDDYNNQEGRTLADGRLALLAANSTLTADFTQWRRVIVTRGQVNNQWITKGYVDGVLFVQANTGVDGNDSMYTYANGQNGFTNVLFGRNGAGAPSGWVSEVRMWDTMLTDEQARDLGGLSVVPEPATMTLLGLGALALIRRKKA